MAKLPSAEDLAGSRPSVVTGATPSGAKIPAVPSLGTGEGEGFAGLGQGLAKLEEVMHRERERSDHVMTEDAFNQLREKQVDLTLGQENGFTQVKGADAVRRPLLKEYTEQFDQAAKQLGQGLANDRQKDAFRVRAGIARAQLEGNILEHVARQREFYESKLYPATVDAEIRNVGANPTDDNVAGFSLERVKAAGASESRRHGLNDPEQIASAQQKATDAVWHARLEAWRLIDPTGALKSFQDNQQQISPEARTKLAESLFKDAAPVLAAQLNEAGGPPVTASSLARVPPGYKKRDFDQNFNTILTPTEEADFQKWKAKNAPNDSGADYDLRGAFKAGLAPAGPEAGKDEGHWPDTFKKPNHPTFSNESRYAPFGKPGRWEGQKFIPPVDQPRGIRNNNPGNIIDGPTKWEGQIEGTDPKYASFASPEAGIRALGKNLLSYQAQGVDSVESIINRWAPATENQTADYVKTVAQKLGVDPREPLNLKDRKTLTALASAIIERENGKNPYSPETVGAGIDSALSGKPFAYEAKRSPGYSVASINSMSAADAINIVTGNPVIDRLPPDQKIAVFHTAKTQANQGMAQVREAMKQRVIDSSAAYERGLDAPNPPTRAELIATFGQFDGEKVAGDLELTRQFGQDVKSVQQLPATQQAALLATRAPVPGEGFAFAERRHDALAKAIDAVQRERQQDPASAVMRNAPQVQAAFQAYTKSQGQDQAAAAQAYAAATVAEQQRLEVRNPQILTKDMVDGIAKRFAEQPAQGENVASVMRGMVEQWGRYWPMVGAQLKGKIPPEAVVIGLGITPEAEALLAETSKLKPEQLNQGIPAPDLKDLKERVRSQFEPLQKTLAWQSGGIETYDNYADSAEKIAVALLQKGMKPKDAASKAFESLAGFKYEFEDTWRVPKDKLGGDTTVSSLRSGAEALKRDVGSNKPVMGEKVGLLVPATPAGVRKEDAEKQWRDTIASNGFWVTSPGDGGLSLYVKSGLGAQPVLDESGRPIRRSWQEISTVGNSVRAAYLRDVYKPGVRAP